MKVEIIADSLYLSRITTMRLTYPRFIHSEFMTHRVFSRNASSSRAIPIERMMVEVVANPAMPVSWGKNQTGMQAGDELDHVDRGIAMDIWRSAAHEAMKNAGRLRDLGVHKQVVNRLLEPFAWITVIVTATEWDNFYTLRRHPDAQPEIQALANLMWQKHQESIPRKLWCGHWHVPFVKYDGPDSLMASAARCARVSYLNHDRSDPDIEKDVVLAKKLITSGHWSPFEHQAQAVAGKSRNFNGWHQYREQLDGGRR